MQKKIYSVLKPKVSAFGFNKAEVMGIAADIANNLNLKEDATDEEIDEAILRQVDSVVPFLKYGQSQANRVINEFKEAANEKKEPERKDEVKEEKKDEKSDDMKALMEMMRSMQEKLNNLEAEKATNSRRSKLEEILKDSGTFGQSKLRDFSRMKFEKEEDFEAYCEEVASDLRSLVQESANNGLAKLTPPKEAKTGAESVMSDDELDQMVDGM